MKRKLAIAIALISVGALAKDVTVVLKGATATATYGHWNLNATDGGVLIEECYDVKDSLGASAMVKSPCVRCEAKSATQGACLATYNTANGF